KQCHRFFEGVTIRLGSLSSWNGHLPAMSLPTFLSSMPAASTRRCTLTSSFSRWTSASGMRAMFTFRRTRIYAELPNNLADASIYAQRMSIDALPSTPPMRCVEFLHQQENSRVGKRIQVPQAQVGS